MGMTLHLKRGIERDLRREAKDGFGRSDLRRYAKKAGGAAELRDAIGKIDLSDEAIERHLGASALEARKHGFLSRLFFGAARADMRDEMREARALLEAQKRQLDDLAADDSLTDDPAGRDAILDLHKSWQVLHYLFTGSPSEGASPGDALLAGGALTGADTGYGRPRILDARKTAAFAGFLEQQSVESLTARLDLEEMASLDLYGAPVENEDDEIDRIEIEETVEHYFPRLRDYMRAAAARGEAVALWMT